MDPETPNSPAWRLCTTPPAGVQPATAVVDKIVGEYTQKITDLANLTADLPRRLQCRDELFGNRAQTNIALQLLVSPAITGCEQAGTPRTASQVGTPRIAVATPNRNYRPHSIAIPEICTNPDSQEQEVSIPTASSDPIQCQETPSNVLAETRSVASGATGVSNYVVEEACDTATHSSYSRSPTAIPSPARSMVSPSARSIRSKGSEGLAARSPGRTLGRASAFCGRVFEMKTTWRWVADDVSADRLAVTKMRASFSCDTEHTTSSVSALNFATKSLSARHFASQTHSSMFGSATTFTISRTQWIVSKPTSSIRMAWELCGLILVLYDLIAIPFLMAFKPPDNWFSDSCGWIVLVFWTLNFPVVLTTGYFEKGVLVMSLRQILLHYVRTWFIVDVASVAPDWLLTLGSVAFDADKDGNAGSLLKVFRMVRLMRLTRLLRMLRLGNAWTVLYELIDSERLGIALQVSVVVFAQLLLTHFAACIWFAIGQGQTGKSWLKEHGFTLKDVSLLHQYLVSFHWAITLFTPASMHVQPQSTLERGFAVTVVILGMVCFSFLVGRITGSLNRLSIMKEHKSKSFRLLRRYLKKCQVQRDLSVRIRSYLEFRWEYQQKNIKSSDVELLGLLSEHLRAELACAVHGPSLLIHPLFANLQDTSGLTIRRVTLRAVSVMSWAPDDVMFVAGEDATHMLLIIAGRVQYHRMPFDDEWDHFQVHVLEPNEGWIAEQVLWVRDWHHLGDLRSLTSTDVLRLSPNRFADIIRLNPLAFRMVAHYAGEYIAWLNRTNRDDLTDVIQEKNNQFGEVSSLPKPRRTNSVMHQSMLAAQIIFRRHSVTSSNGRTK